MSLKALTKVNIGDSDSGAPLPSSLPEKIDNNDSYTCTDCQSEIEIFSIDKIKIKITFQCLNNDIEQNHGIKSIPIKDYINLMKKNTYLYSVCSNPACSKIQKNEKNNDLFNYCVGCQKIICKDCSEEHIKNNSSSHYLIKINKKGILCQKHPTNKNLGFCLKCKTHFCSECELNREHRRHEKDNFLEVQPSNEEKKIMQDYINSLKNNKKKLEEEKEIKLIELFNKRINDFKNITKQFNKLVKNEESKIMQKYHYYRKKLISELKILKMEYENKMKKQIDLFKELWKNTMHKHLKMVEKIRIINDKAKKDKIEVKYNNDKNSISYFYDKQISDINDLLDIYELIKYSYDKYEDNYYNRINFLSALSSINNTKRIGDSFQLKSKINDENKEKYQKQISLLKYENNELQNKCDKLEKERDDINKKNLEILKVLDNLKRENDRLLNEKKKESLAMKIPKEFKNCPKAYNKNGNRNSFCTFTSIEKILTLVFGIKEKSIQFLNLSNFKIIKEIKNAHNSFISSLRYYLYNNNHNKQDLILSVCADNSEIKVWDANKYTCLTEINKVYKKGEMLSVCLIFLDNGYNILTSNFHVSSSFPIKMFDSKGNQIKIISQSNDKTYYMDIFNCEKRNIKYAITANENCVKSYNINEDRLYNKYSDNDNIEHSYFILNEYENCIKLMESSKNGFLRVWNFDSKELLLKIKTEYNNIFNFCEWDNNFIFFTCEENNSIILINLFDNKTITKLTGKNNNFYFIQKIKHPEYGDCLISQGKV